MSKSAQATLAFVMFMGIMAMNTTGGAGMALGFCHFLAIAFVIWVLGGCPGRFFGGG